MHCILSRWFIQHTTDAHFAYIALWSSAIPLTPNPIWPRLGTAGAVLLQKAREVTSAAGDDHRRTSGLAAPKKVRCIVGFQAHGPQEVPLASCNFKPFVSFSVA